MLGLLGLLGFVLIGLIVATIAKGLLPGRDPAPASRCCSARARRSWCGWGVE
jgi:hypothetical protein